MERKPKYVLKKNKTVYKEMKLQICKKTGKEKVKTQSAIKHSAFRKAGAGLAGQVRKVLWTKNKTSFQGNVF